MTRCRQLSAAIAVALTSLTFNVVAADLLTIEQAEERSRTTGRPILAMAGSKT